MLNVIKNTNKTYTMTEPKTVDNTTRLRMPEQKIQNKETAQISQHNINTKKEMVRNKKEQ
jgi:hypothetical protein